MNEATLNQLLENLIHVSGMGSVTSELKLLDGDSVRVLVDGVVAYYPVQCWTSRFLRQLYTGFFEEGNARPMQLA